MRRLQAFALIVAAFALTTAPAIAADPKAKPLDFNRDIRPILSDACYQCHGPDRAKRKANLRLDISEKNGGLVGLTGVPVIAAGNPDDSLLIERILSDDVDEKMPPPDSGKSLTPTQIQTLRRWIADGAEFKGHWAYIPPVRPALPEGPPSGFVRSEIDKFVLATLSEKGLKPSPEADRVTLIRRLGFDLRGLPPSPAEVDAFVNDRSSEALETLVDKMIASPQYGERMAGLWLDLVRYADTDGYHGDNHRDVTLYRDYVIDVFNKNVPFDKFSVEQLAGDLLPDRDDRQLIASGYNKLLMTTREGGAQPKEYTAKYAADRVRNASTVWLGATLGCAECHDHKFDPFTTKDFYRFAAFFADIQEAAVGVPEPTRVPTPEQAARRKALDAEIAALQSTLDAPTSALAASQADWEKTESSRVVSWAVVKPIKASSAGGATLSVLDDGSIKASGTNPDRDTYSLTFKGLKPALTALRLEVMPDGGLPALGPGRADNGNFVLNELTVSAEGAPVVFSGATASHSQAGFPIAHTIDGKAETGWAILNEAGRPNVAVFESKENFGPCCDQCLDDELTVALTFHYGTRHTLGRFRLSATTAPRPVLATGVPKVVADALAVLPEKRNDAQKKALADHYRSIAPVLEPLRTKLLGLKKAKTDLDASMPVTLVTRAGPPRMTRVLPRGNWLDDSGAVVTPGVPAFLTRPEDKRPTRLELARWIASKENPLTARVFVNRIWALAFGQGIVATADDFGAQGSWPTHPELLDWLAIDFTEHHWDVKRLVKQIITSGAYRQSSAASNELRQKDPYNQWVARQGRFRIDAESVRDTALSVSGLLIDQLGGPSARPYQPAGYWAHLNFPKREYEPDHGAGLYRRGLYTYWCRTFLHPSLLAFDAPSREECTARRTRSNTPLQALVLLNDPIYVEAARALAEQTLRQGGGSIASRMEWAYRRVLSRKPRPEESTVLTALLERHRSDYKGDPAAAKALLHTGERAVPADLDAVELAAWTSAARVILNLHETITRN